MQPNHREQAIIEHLQAGGSGRIADLARQLGVTAETIRRNLLRLEERGLVLRLRGGVTLAERAEPPFGQRFAAHPEAKRRIAAAVAQRVLPGETLFLDVGTTTAYVAQALRGHAGLMVVTNSLPAAQALLGMAEGKVHMAGGELRAHDGGAFGAAARDFLDQFHLGTAVLSASGLMPGGYFLQDPAEADFARLMIARARRRILVADASKFARTGPVRVADFAAIELLVTDAPPPAALQAALEQAEVEILLA